MTQNSRVRPIWLDLGNGFKAAGRLAGALIVGIAKFVWEFFWEHPFLVLATAYAFYGDASATLVLLVIAFYFKLADIAKATETLAKGDKA